MTTYALIPRIALTLLMGLVGGVLFFWLTLPLPWMLGALTVTLIAAVANVPIQAPERLRNPVVAIIGVLLGSGFTPELVEQVGAWGWSLGALAAYLVVAAALVVPYYRRFGGFDSVTAYFAGMPGGLTEMVTLGRAAGADERKIVLAHAARVVVVVALIAFWFRVIEGQTVGSRTSGLFTVNLTLRDGSLLLASGFAGAFLGRLLHLPAPILLGPMILSGAAHMTGLTASAPPAVLVVTAQVMLGTIMGCRFLGTRARAVGVALGLAVGATLITLTVAVLVAVVLVQMVGLPFDQLILAYAPGGLTEMTLVALAINADVAFVALHHVARIVMIIAIAPLLPRLFGSSGEGSP